MSAGFHVGTHKKKTKKQKTMKESENVGSFFLLLLLVFGPVYTYLN
jgi:hypothetical protein